MNWNARVGDAPPAGVRFWPEAAIPIAAERYRPADRSARWAQGTSTGGACICDAS